MCVGDDGATGAREGGREGGREDVALFGERRGGVRSGRTEQHAFGHVGRTTFECSIRENMDRRAHIHATNCPNRNDVQAKVFFFPLFFIKTCGGVCLC